MKEVSTSALRCEPFSIYHTIYNEIDSREQMPLRARDSMNSFVPSRTEWNAYRHGRADTRSPCVSLGQECLRNGGDYCNIQTGLMCAGTLFPCHQSLLLLLRQVLPLCQRPMHDGKPLPRPSNGVSRPPCGASIEHGNRSCVIRRACSHCLS